MHVPVNAPAHPRHRFCCALPDHGGLSSWAWSISHMHALNHRKATVIGQPTFSSSGGLIRHPRRAAAPASETRHRDGATMQNRVHLQVEPPCREQQEQ
jgi:hypothetical protein